MSATAAARDNGRFAHRAMGRGRDMVLFYTPAGAFVKA